MLRASTLLSIVLALFMTPSLSNAAGATEPVTLRCYQGNAIYIHNPDGQAFDINLELFDWNLMEPGPREVLVKVYGPDGETIVREVIEDDGASGEPLVEAGGWDHEMWYYALLYGRGSQPAFSWSSMTDPARLNRLKSRMFRYRAPALGAGTYRVLLMGSRDHVARFSLSRPLDYGIAGTPLWYHARGPGARRYVYVPRGTTELHLGFAEFDLPVTRTFTLRDPDGGVIWEGMATGGFATQRIELGDTRNYDDTLLTIEASDGSGDYMLHLQLGRRDAARGGAPATYFDNPEAARAVRGGAIYHDGEVYWHHFQVRLHDWIKSLDESAFIVRTPDGQPAETRPGPTFGRGARSIEYVGLPTRPGYVTLNGPHEPPPVSDTLMHHYPDHKDSGTLHMAIRDLHQGFRMLTVGDSVAPRRWNGNMGYIFGTYAFHYWRPAWRVLQAQETPPAAREAVREAVLMAGDRLAFSRGIERVNGNAFSHIPQALAYAAAAVEDPLMARLADEYLDRFANGGWGAGTGISPSGDCMEHFGHDYHYGTYILANYRAPIADLGDERFRRIRDGVYEVYRHIFCPDANAWVFGSRTGNAAGQVVRAEDYYGQPGPDFTRGVGGANAWFAARRANYYLLSFHGHLTPTWLNNYFDTCIGYGGGAICQLHVPGHGTVIASRQHGSYGQNMQPEKWRAFAVHSIVGELADGRPLVAADSIHHNVRLEGKAVISSGEVRDRPVHSHRTYTYENDHIIVQARLADTDLRQAYWDQGRASTITSAWEMIPYVSGRAAAAARVTLLDANGASLGDIGAEPVTAAAIVIDRGGYGARIELDQPRPVHRGESDTVMIELVNRSSRIDAAAIEYRVTPFVGN